MCCWAEAASRQVRITLLEMATRTCRSGGEQMTDCVFCLIAAKQIPAKVVFEDAEFIAFHDIQPAAPVHILVIPKRHIGSLQDAKSGDQGLLGRLLLLANQVAEEVGLTGYRVAINVGKDGGQVVPHLHLHILGGKSAAELPALG